MPVYDDQKEKQSTEPGAHDDLGVHPERREAEVDDLENLYNSESAPSGGKASTLEEKEKAAIDKTTEPSSGGDWKTDVDEGGPTKLLGIFNRRQALIGGGGIVGIVGLLIFIFGFLAGPAQFIHYAQLLEKFHFGNGESFSDSRVSKLIRHARNTQYRSNLSPGSNILADRYETKLRAAGFEPDYKSTRSIQEIKIDSSSSEGKRALSKLEAAGVSLPTPDGEGKVVISLRGDGSTKLSRQVMLEAIDSISLNGMSSALSKRLLFKRAGVNFHPLRNKVREKTEDIADFRKKVKDEVETEVQNGSKKVVENVGLEDDSDGTSTATADDARAANQASDEATALLREAGVEGTTPKQVSASLKRTVQTAGIGLGTVTIMCGLNSFGDAIPDMRQANVVLPLIRNGMRVVTTGASVMADMDVSNDELAVLSESFFDPETGTAASAARSIQAELGQELTGPDMPDASKPDTSKPRFFQSLSSVINALPGGPSTCNFVTSTVGGFLVDAADIALSIGTGGVYAGIRAAGGAGLGFVAGIGLEPLLDNLAQWIAGQPVEKFARGALFGNYANYGVLLAANDNQIAMGGKKLSSSESAALDMQQYEREKIDLQHKSFYARYLDPYETKSLVATTMLENSTFTTSSRAMAVVKTPLTSLSGIGKQLSSLLTPSSFADTLYDYGFPEYGFSVNEIDDPRVDNPYENAEIVEAKLTELNERYKNCFGTTIDASGKIVTEAASRYDKIDADPNCSDGSEDLLRYRMYLADTVAIQGLRCYENINEDSCAQLGVGGAEPAQPTTPTTGPAPSVAEAKGKDTSAEQCSVGTDAGIGDTPVEGIKIRLCKIGSTTVNVAIEKNVKAVFDAGVVTGGGGYRSYAQQVKTRIANGCPDIYTSPASSCSPPTARPGTSMHEWGLAVDFTQGGSTLTKGSSGFKWMEANQAIHQLKNLPSEAWHWSTNGN